MVCYCRLQEEYERSDPHQAQASAMFEEELQSLQARLDDEFGKDSDKEGMSLTLNYCVMICL